MRINSKISGIVEEAKSILKDSKLPVSSIELGIKQSQHKSRLTLEAELVVHAEYYLLQAIKNNAADEAASRMFDLCVAYLRMTDLRDVPESAEWTNLIDKDLENEYAVYIKSYRAGFKNLLRNKNKSNRITYETQTKLQTRAIELRNEDPHKLNKKIVKQLIEEFKGIPGASQSNITKNIKIPKKIPKR